MKKLGYRIEVMPGLYVFQSRRKFWWRRGFPMRHVWRLQLFLGIVWRRYDEQSTDRMDVATAWSVASIVHGRDHE